jgi:hypothetical protein
MKAPKRKIFVSYHHRGDQTYYDAFVKAFADSYEVFSDNSLERAYESDDVDYVRWQIRQNDITGSSCTIVLCGAKTQGRKYVDWEIKATLDKQHGLIGIGLPTAQRTATGTLLVPDRFADDYASGHAQWLLWEHLSAAKLKETIEAAVGASARLIRNDRAMRQRNA